MDIQTAVALIGATIVLVLLPGPNLALFLANTISHGRRIGAVTVLGTSVGIAIQLGLVLVGLNALLSVAASAFVWLKWAGVAYLLYLGVQSWRRGNADRLALDRQAREPQRAFLQGLGLSLLNPKTLLFNAAFLPQFVAADAGAVGFLVPAVLYLAVIIIGDLMWVALAGSAAPALHKLGPLRHRLTGGFFIASGVGLAIARAER